MNEIWIAEADRSGRIQLRRLDSGRADPEGVAQWLAPQVGYILFFAELSPSAPV